MTTPLQKAAQALMDALVQTDFTCRLGEQLDACEKALDAEIAQSVEPVAWANMREDSAPVLLSISQHAEDRANWGNPVPLYMHPPQPQATTAVPEGYVLVDLSDLKKLSHSICGECYMGCDWEIKCIKSMIAAAQGEKP